MNIEETREFSDTGKELIEDYFDGIEHSALKKPKKMSRIRFSSITEIPLIITGIGLVILIIILAVFIPKDNVNSGAMQFSRMDDRIQQMNARLSRIEKAIQNKDSGKGWMDDVDTLRIRIRSLESDILSRFDVIDKKLNTSGNQLTSLEKPVPVKRRETGLEKSKSPKKSSAESYHNVTSGETLYGISRKYSLSVAQMQQMNPAIEGKNIFPGQKLRIK